MSITPDELTAVVNGTLRAKDMSADLRTRVLAELNDRRSELSVRLANRRGEMILTGDPSWIDWKSLVRSASGDNPYAFPTSEYIHADEHEQTTSHIHMETPDVSEPVEGSNHSTAKLFFEVFRVAVCRHLSISYGWPRSDGHKFHPDNYAAGRPFTSGLRAVFGVKHTIRVDQPTCDLRDDIILFGGPNSTLLTGAAFEYEGEGHRIRRRSDPALSLPFTYSCDETAEDELVWRYMEGEGAVPIVRPNWTLFAPDWYTGPHRAPRSASADDIDGKKAFELTGDSLRITRVPNFMSPTFQDQIGGPAESWPYLLVVAGGHGLGTRATELLFHPENDPLLRDIQSRLDNSQFFQVLLWVGGVDTARRFHRATRIDSAPIVVPLPHDRQTYLRAMERFREPFDFDWQDGQWRRKPQYLESPKPVL